MTDLMTFMHDACCSFEKRIVPVLARVATAVREVAASPKIPGYTDYFSDRAAPEAHFLACAVRQCGEDAYRERRAERVAAFYLRKIARSRKKATTVRYAKELVKALERWGGLQMLPDCAQVLLAELLEHVVLFEQDVSCEALRSAAATIIPNLRDQRGLTPGPISSMHEIFLTGCNEGPNRVTFSYSEAKGRCTDRATEATRLAMNAPDFDPRPVVRSMLKRGLINRTPQPLRGA